MKNISRFLSLCFFCSWGVVAAQNDCLLLSKFGMYDTNIQTSEYQRTISYLNIFKQDQDMTYEEAENLGLSIGIPIGDLLASLGFAQSKEGFSEFRESIQNTVDYDDAIINKTMTLVRRVSPDLATILKDCFNSNGVHVYFETSADPNVFIIRSKFKWNGNHDDARVNLKWSGGGFTIDNKAVSDSFEEITFKLANGNERAFIVRRVNNESMGFVITSNSRGVDVYGSSVVVPKIKIPQPDKPGVYRPIIVEREITDKTSRAEHCGGDDRELRRFDTTQLTGDACLVLLGGNLVLKVNAEIKQILGDRTCFRIRDNLPIYTPPAGYSIHSFRVENLSSTCYEMFRAQKTWVESVQVTDAIIEYYRWQGDSGKTDDSKDGCWLKFKPKPILVMLVRNSTPVN